MKSDKIDEGKWQPSLWCLVLTPPPRALITATGSFDHHQIEVFSLGWTHHIQGTYTLPAKDNYPFLPLCNL